LANTPLALIMHFSPLYFWPIAKKNPKCFSKILRKKIRDYFKIICGSLACFSTISFNIWAVNLQCTILT
jgi:hypothetical protein